MTSRLLYCLFIASFLTAFSSPTEAVGRPPAPAQVHPQRPVTGLVSDPENQPLPGVAVLEKGTHNGTLTDAHGLFKIKVSEGAVLVFSMSGYTSVEAPVGDQLNLTVRLTPNQENLKDVVVVGYGTQKRSDLTGSVSSMKASDLASMPVSNPVLAMEAKVPGLSISNNSGRPGGDLDISIRGLSSINATNAPLFVIDGVIGANFQSINPGDIETIDILKDASATAIYGSQASAGVIIVTTKKAKPGEFSVSMDNNVAVSELPREIPMLNSTGYMQYEQRYWEYNPLHGAFPTDKLDSLYPTLFNANGTPRYNTDWQKVATRHAASDMHYLSLTGGTDKSTQGLYLGYINNQGILLNTYYQKYSIRYNTETKIRPWLTLGGTMSYYYTKKNQVDDYSVGSMTATRLLEGMIPILPVQYPDGTYSTMEDYGFDFNPDGSYFKSPIYGASNPVQLLKDLKYYRYESQVLGNLYGVVRITPDLDFKTTMGAQVYDANDQLYVSRELLDIGQPTNGVAMQDDNRTVYWQSESFLTYHKHTGFNNYNVVLGASWTQSTTTGFSASATQFSTDYYGFNNLGAGAVSGTPSSSYSSESLNSYYARVNYSWKEKYLLTATGRYDGSSKFGTDNKYAFFPSVAGGWNVSKEDFLKDSRTVSNLKLRASYGITGNSGISPYQSLGTITSGITYLNQQPYSSSTQGTVPNPNLKWEQTGQLDIGADLGLFHGRLNVTGDVYDKKTKNLLLANPISYVSGYSSVFTNIGSVRNRGLELSANGTVIQEKDWTWSLSGTFSENRNRILALGTGNADIYNGYAPGPGIVYTRLHVGGSIGDLFGYDRLGTWGTAEAGQAALYGRNPGDIKWLDVNGDHQYTNADAMVLGNVLPRYEMGLGTTVRYKNWDLQVNIQIRHGNKVVNASSFELEDRQFYLNSYGSLLKDAWTPTHQNAYIPAIRSQEDPLYSDYPPGFIDSHWVEDGSFIRGQNLTLGYNLTAKALSRIGFKRLRIYGNAQNFFLITHYRGYDPELSSVGAGTFNEGVDYFSYPNPRTYTLGATVTF